jgi:sulfate/thiosulfate transport system permease protein
MIGIVLIAYVSILILAPLIALTVNAFEKGVGAIFSSFGQSYVLLSFWNTFWIGLIVVSFIPSLGPSSPGCLSVTAFRGRDLINGLVDMPFAVSPVVAGYMLLLLFGRNGLLAPFVEATGIRVAFAFPGMVLATLFVTLPFMIRELVPVLEAFRHPPGKAAATLGASGWQTFWRVTFPCLAMGNDLWGYADLRPRVGRVRRGAGHWRGGARQE